MFVIVIDHMGKFPSVYDVLTGRGAQWISAAEGFFFVSGMMVGMVRGRQALRDGIKAAARKLWRRAFVLYVWSVLLTFGFTAWGSSFREAEGVKGGLVGPEGIAQLLRDTLLLRYVYGWTDFLSHYVIFLLFAPLALYFLMKRRGWIPVVLASFVVWLLRGNSFDRAWQLLFMWGVVAGYHYQEIVGYWKKFPRSWRWPAIGLAGTVTAVALWFSEQAARGRYYLISKDFVYQAFHRDTLQPGRLALFLLFFVLLFLTVRRFEKPIERYLGWFLRPLGQNSLYVFIMQGIIIFGLTLTWPHTYAWWQNFLLDTAVLGVLWLCVKKRFLFWIIPR